MPQDSRRSAGYKSFVTCGDPKGFAECKPIRKSPTGSDKVKKSQKSSSKALSLDEQRSDKAAKRSAEDVRVLEVSRGAQKLNEVIDSLSHPRSLSKQSEYIAKDLLKGALDLQESLAMLRKLQESSKYMARSKKKDKEKPVGDVVMEFNPIAEYDHFQQPRTSTSSRDCFEELREVIVKSFSRNNLLPKSSVNEKDTLNRKSVDFFMDVPSSSSSYSWSSSDGSASRVQDYSAARVLYEKPKRPNLVAKLMGLEDVSSKQDNSVLCRQMDGKGLSRPLLDIDQLRRPRKPEFMVQKPVRETRPIEELVETTQFKVLVEKKSVHGSYFECQTPPIVIMKPLHVLDLQTKEFHANYSTNDEKYTKSRQFVPTEMQDEFAIRGSQGRSSFRELNEKLPARKVPKKVVKDKQCNNTGESPARLPKKFVNNIQDAPSLVKTRHPSPLSPNMQKKRTVVKKMDGVQKMSSDTGKKADIKPSKSQDPFNRDDTGKQAYIKPSKAQDSVNRDDLCKTATPTNTRPGKGSNVTKSQIARGKHTAPDKPTTAQKTLKSSTLKKNLKEDKPNSNALATSVESIPRDDDCPINLAASVPGSVMKRVTSDQILEEVANASCIPISDNFEDAASYPCEPPDSTIQDVKYLEDGNFTLYQSFDEKKDCRTNTGYFLLYSASFLHHAKMLLDIEADDPTILPTDQLPGSESHDDHLLLDCAKEILEDKSKRCTKFPLSLNYFTGKPNCHSTLDQLVSEISDVIENLRSYKKSFGDTILVDSISLLLERDLCWNGKLTGVWDSGWKGGFSVEEINEVANDLQNSLLSEMVDDVVAEIMP